MNAADVLSPPPRNPDEPTPTPPVSKTETPAAEWEYQTDKVMVLPYLEDKFPETMLLVLFQKLREDKLLSKVFPGMGEMTLNRFVAYMTAHPPVIGFVKSAENKVGGLIWLTEMDGPAGARRASFGFAFFKEFWGTVEVRQMAYLFLRRYFVSLGVDVLFGTTLKTNQFAKGFAREMGFDFVADLPLFFSRNGVLEDASLVVLTKGKFMLLQSPK